MARWLIPRLMVAALAVATLVWAGVGVGLDASPSRGSAAFGAGCLSDNPYFVTSLVPRSTAAAAVVAFRSARHYYNPIIVPLAGADVTGTVFGLAVDVRHLHIYAAAVANRRLTTTRAASPGGLGAIYRIDLASGTVALWARVDADTPVAKDWTSTGTVGLGDVEFDPASSSLLAANLRDRTIVRLAVPDGRLLDTIAHGASAEAWAPNARIFGLGVKEGWLYHGVVDSREHPSLPGSLGGYVYRSRVDGTEMTEVVRFDLAYPHTPPWRGWTGAEPGAGDPSDLAGQPMMVDLEVRANGDLIIGLRDRASFLELEEAAPGDVLLADCQVEPCAVMTAPGHYGASGKMVGHKLLGSLAIHPRRDWVLARVGTNFRTDGGVAWIDNVTGSPAERGRYFWLDAIDGEEMVGGDIEALCETTSIADTLYLPSTLQRSSACRKIAARMVLVLDLSTTMRRPGASGAPTIDLVLAAVRSVVGHLDFTPDGFGCTNQIGIVAFNDTAWIEQPFTSQPAELAAAIDRLPAKMVDGSRIDLGLAEAVHLVDSNPPRGPGPTVAVLVSDGIPNRVPPAADGSIETTVLEAAGNLKRPYVDEVFVVGMGAQAELNHDLLRAIATDRSTYLWTTRAEDLERLLMDVARRVTCQ